MRKLRKILLSTIFALTVSTTFFANTAGTQTVTAASGTAVTFKRKVIAYRTGSVVCIPSSRQLKKYKIFVLPGVYRATFLCRQSLLFMKFHWC